MRNRYPACHNCRDRIYQVGDICVVRMHHPIVETNRREKPNMVIAMVCEVIIPLWSARSAPSGRKPFLVPTQTQLRVNGRRVASHGSWRRGGGIGRRRLRRVCAQAVGGVENLHLVTGIRKIDGNIGATVRFCDVRTRTRHPRPIFSRTIFEYSNLKVRHIAVRDYGCTGAGDRIRKVNSKATRAARGSAPGVLPDAHVIHLHIYTGNAGVIGVAIPTVGLSDKALESKAHFHT